jgi:hypothetical protein
VGAGSDAHGGRGAVEHGDAFLLLRRSVARRGIRGVPETFATPGVEIEVLKPERLSRLKGIQSCRRSDTTPERDVSHKGMTWWSGTCGSPTVQNRLLAALERLAHGLPGTTRHDKTIVGRIAVDPDLLGADWDEVIATTTRAGVPIVCDGKHGTRQYPVVREVHIRGIEFSPLEPIWNERIIFIFARCAELPGLNGRLIEVWDADDVLAFKPRRLYSGLDDGTGNIWRLKAPFCDTSYCLADFVDRLLAWVRCFFVQDLEYTRYDGFSPQVPRAENDGLLLYLESYRLSCLEVGPVQAEREIFGYILGSLQSERQWLLEQSCDGKSAFVEEQ